MYLNSWIYGKKLGMKIGKSTKIELSAQIIHPRMVSIGNNTYIGDYCNIRPIDREIKIGNNVQIGQFVSIIGANHKFRKKNYAIAPDTFNSQTVIIENNVWIGANVIILPGVTIGEGAVIGAGTVVSRDVPKYAIFVGTPGSVIDYRR